MQLELYNKRDADEFMTLFDPDCQLLDLQTGKELARGHDQIRARYIERFKSPVYCSLYGRLAIGKVVVDREHISGLPNGAEANCMAVYQVNERGLIHRVQFVWEDIKPSK
ncbi:hypothetical protein GUITHDRAFT_73934 [Guillardia theta CCMP2712]|uniref:SnoaL-like domain-containing protein n=1 Tax=Guillardia theta (strain CCMP2712) TaxID=905079 RepID=L1J212_GUITC|nr:hypothetical protein GUITHDRAFT_73934 [Guillardia theta CCMP2712]EKX42561.1 hypothetical protein GUITHDRAFT_73934 [Guillardia theta CCMP2712]|eukprot:XP_005829541.1 hypothetical protein GUITHDRAFT_73934 [Guillardia theta CCMP2712]